MPTTTTPEAIRTALHTKLAAITPTGTSLGNAVYQRNSKFFRQEDRPASDRDRQFNIERFRTKKQEDFGVHTEALKEAEFDLWIGHTKGTDEEVGGGRRDRDLEQIIAALEWPANRPSGVAAIEFLGFGQEVEDDLGWDTQLLFRCRFLGIPSFT